MLSGKCPGNNPENQDKVLGYQEGRYERRTDDGQEQFYKPCVSVLESVWLKLWGWDPSVFGLLKKLNSCNIECHKEQSDPCPWWSMFSCCGWSGAQVIFGHDGQHDGHTWTARAHATTPSAAINAPIGWSHFVGAYNTWQGITWAVEHLSFSRQFLGLL